MGAAFLHALVSDAVTLTASSAETNLGVANLQDPQEAKVWRATDCSAEYVVGDAGAAVDWSAFVISGTNLTRSGTMRVRLADTQAHLTDGNAAYDSGTFSRPEGEDTDESVKLMKLFPTVSARWFRIDLADPTNPDGYIEVGRLLAGEYWSPTIAPAFGGSIGFIDPSHIVTSVGGQDFVDELPRRKEIEAYLRYMGESDALGQAYEYMRQLGQAKDLFLCIDTAATTHFQRKSVHGRIVSLRTIDNTVIDRHDLRVRVRQSL